MSENGTSYEGAALIGPFAQAGFFNTDGQGNVNIQLMASYNGFITNGDSTATYTISPDCILSYEIMLPPPLIAPAKFYGVLSDRNRQMTLTISEPPGNVVVGYHTKQDTNFCGVADLNGAYHIDMDGGITMPGPRQGKFHRLGRLLADGKGNFTVTSIDNYAGLQVPVEFSGTYDVNGRCILSMHYQNGNDDITVYGVGAGHGDFWSIIITTPGWSSAGFLRAQQ